MQNHNKEQNKWLKDSEKLPQFIVTNCGTWTSSLPYAPVAGTFERTPASDTVYPAYPVLLGG